MWGNMVESRFNRSWKMCQGFYFEKKWNWQQIILLGILLGKEEKQGRQEDSKMILRFGR